MRAVAAVVLLLLAATGGCGDAHDPGDEDAGSAADAGGGDAAATPDVGERCEPEAVPAGGFSAAESYLETEAPGCDETCLVYQVAGDPRSDCTEGCSDPAEADERVFCTCRCDGPEGEEPFCTCPAAFRCEAVLDSEFADPSIRGSYCVRDSL